MDEPTGLLKWLSTAVIPGALWLGRLHTKVNRNEQDIQSVQDEVIEQGKAIARIEGQTSETLHILKNGHGQR